ncbi:sigma-70 family RNA polymerase sigma factor [Olivibacter sp. SDN3]|uniref:RNA polymerase sigma factor n=1 Tax=Olivibacter sp. SDN3 TaxID=2764720 RepID=UPI001650E5EA|nr:sigma-70 family RNA polymerase sigma factor [Olivibacter sp. SDN3]QNL51052.1 sigma-70 family RNA polymerase sigma factor [Olivibacter sp. SDN3]
MDNYTLQELFLSVKKGDAEAFTTLYRHTWRELYLLAFNKTRDEDESKDVVQEIYIQLWQKREVIQIRGPVEAYLYSMTKYEIIRRMQRVARWEEQKFDYQQLVDAMTAASDQDIFANELHERFSQQVEQLPEKQQRIFKLHNEENYTTQEIAKEMQLAEQTVKNQLVHAKRKIRVAMKEHLLSTLFLL